MATLQIRVDDVLKKQADALFSSLGLDTSTAIRIFLMQLLKMMVSPFLFSIKQFLLLFKKLFMIVDCEEILTDISIMPKKLFPLCWRIDTCTKLFIQIA